MKPQTESGKRLLELIDIAMDKTDDRAKAVVGDIMELKDRVERIEKHLGLEIPSVQDHSTGS